MDITDIIDYNMETLNHQDLGHSFMQISKTDPTEGFQYDANTVAGHTYPEAYELHKDFGTVEGEIALRLRLGGHFAFYLRHELERQKGYTSTVGIATSKLISKLVGNLHKPKGQTTMMPPLTRIGDRESNVMAFIDDHEIGKIPGLGFKLALQLREAFLKRESNFDNGLVYGVTIDKVTVRDVRTQPDVNPESLEKLLGGPGSPHGIGLKVWQLLHGVDDTEVEYVRTVPRQISIEDSYIRLDTFPEVLKELKILANSLIARMRMDLLIDADSLHDTPLDPMYESEQGVAPKEPQPQRRWLAHPKTVRLSTRPRQPLQPDGTRVRSFKRISHSTSLPMFVFNTHESVEVLADKLIKDVLITMFRKLHPGNGGWNLSLVNLAVTNMVETAGDGRTSVGRDIGNMFRRQEDILKDFRVVEEEEAPAALPLAGGQSGHDKAADATNIISDGEDEDAWDEADGENDADETCASCGMRMPSFAMLAHLRFHSTDHSE
jgi:DNA polymerase iota